MERIVGMVRRAIADYGMIEAGDRVAVGISGGKDSICLVTALAEFRRYSPFPFTLCAINIDMNFEETSADEVAALTRYLAALEVPFYHETTDIAKILFERRKESNPCSLCSKMRRGALSAKCVALGINKLCLGHHSDDVLETMLLSFFYEGRLSCFAPVSYLSRTGITVIRPLIYVEEADIKGAAARNNFPIVHNPCPADKHTQREEMKTLVKTIQKKIPFAKERMLSAIMSPERNNLHFEKVAPRRKQNAKTQKPNPTEGEVVAKVEYPTEGETK